MQASFCKSCGSQLKDGARFCSKCGTPVDMPDTPKDNHIPETPIFSEPLPGLRRNLMSDNPEGTVLLGGTGPSLNEKTDILGGARKSSDAFSSVRKAELRLSFTEMLRGCSKVIDFGTGRRYEIVIPAGLNPGDVIKVKDTGIIDPESLRECEIELTTVID